MPDGWIHQALDLYCFDEIYWSTHLYKDSPSRTLPGKKHRQLRHGEWKEWENVGKKSGWLDSAKDIQNVIELLQKLVQRRIAGKYPRTAPNKEQLAAIGHELLDYMWDDMDAPSRYFVGYFIKHNILSPSEDSFLLPKERQSQNDYKILIAKLRRQSLTRLKKKLPTNIKEELDRLSGILNRKRVDAEYLNFRSQKSFVQMLDEMAEKTKDISTESYQVMGELLSFLKPHLAEMNPEEQEYVCRILYVINSFVDSPILCPSLEQVFAFLSGAYTLLTGSAQGFTVIVNHFKTKSLDVENSGLFPELSSELNKLINQLEAETG